ncbi:membrane protein [Thermogymnomonas acidicola]|uniref:Membrane protein n=1 Tax=Thermogymnomonas acidicola TaxID=399579 RepID=A0AA37BQN9_9ARCH|nr:DMT family transporter [Thermogymnomonas acidicola]GGM70146.1 membrane protein [Thermogymnomonas acidicola]
MNRIYYVALLVLVTFIWGVTFPMIKVALASVEPSPFLALRFAISAALLLPFALRRRGSFSLTSSVYGLISGAFLFAGYFFQTLGLDYTSPALSGIITGLYVILIPIFSLLILRAPVARMDIVASVLALTGLIVMSVTSLSSRSTFLGNMLTVACAVAYALQTIYVSKYTYKVDSVTFTFYQMATVAALSSVFVPITGERFTVPGSYAWFAIAFTAVFASVLAYYINTVALRYIEPTAAGVIYTGEPVFAALTSYLFYGDAPGYLTLSGMALMVAAMLLTTLDKYIRSRVH